MELTQFSSLKELKMCVIALTSCLHTIRSANENKKRTAGIPPRDKVLHELNLLRNTSLSTFRLLLGKNKQEHPENSQLEEYGEWLSSVERDISLSPQMYSKELLDMYTIILWQTFSITKNDHNQSTIFQAIIILNPSSPHGINLIM